MTDTEKRSWITTLEDAASRVSALCGPDIVDFILSEYGVRSIDELKPSQFHMVYSDLSVVETNYD